MIILNRRSCLRTRLPDVLPDVAGARRGELEGLDGEGEVLVVGVVDEHPLVGELLHALGLVVPRAVRDQGARLPGVEALLNPGGSYILTDF